MDLNWNWAFDFGLGLGLTTMIVIPNPMHTFFLQAFDKPDKLRCFPGAGFDRNL